MSLRVFLSVHNEQELFKVVEDRYLTLIPGQIDLYCYVRYDEDQISIVDYFESKKTDIFVFYPSGGFISERVLQLVNERQLNGSNPLIIIVDKHHTRRMTDSIVEQLSGRFKYQFTWSKNFIEDITSVAKTKCLSHLRMRIDFFQFPKEFTFDEAAIFISQKYKTSIEESTKIVVIGDVVGWWYNIHEQYINLKDFYRIIQGDHPINILLGLKALGKDLYSHDIIAYVGVKEAETLFFLRISDIFARRLLIFISRFSTNSRVNIVKMMVLVDRRIIFFLEKNSPYSYFLKVVLIRGKISNKWIDFLKVFIEKETGQILLPRIERRYFHQLENEIEDAILVDQNLK